MKYLKIIIIFVVVLIGVKAYTQTPYLSPDGDTLYIGEYTVLRNQNGYLPLEDYSDYSNFPGLITEWGEEIYVSDTTTGAYIVPRIVVSNSLLHVFGKRINTTPFAPHHYISSDNGDTWEFFGDYTDTTMNIGPGIINAYCDNNKLYTTWIGRRGNFPEFICFRGSNDHGRTWPIYAELCYSPSIHNYRRGNISGHGDTVFVSFIQFGGPAYDSIACWRSFDMGIHWDDPGFIAGCEGISYAPSIVYNAGVVSIVYNKRTDPPLDVFYINSFDRGVTWSEPLLLSFPDEHSSQWPEVAADSLGNVAVCWMDYLGSPYWWTGGIWCRISHDSGQTWNEAVRLDSDYKGNVGTSAVIDGDYVAVSWYDCELDRCMYYRESWDGGQNWGEQQVISSGTNYCPRLVKFHDIVHLVWWKEERLDDGRHWDFIKYMRNDNVVGIRLSESTLYPDQFDLSAYPNPFNTTIVLILNGFEGGDAKVNIYNIAGRFVKTLTIDRSGKTTWDATDAMGNKVSSGIYFAKVKTEQGEQAIKLVYLK